MRFSLLAALVLCACDSPGVAKMDFRRAPPPGASGGTWVAKFIAHVATFDPIGQIEAGVGMIAAGALLKSIAGSFGHSGSGGGGGGGGSYGGSSALGSIIDRGVIDPNTYSQRSGASIPQRQAVTVNATIIGKDDPNAQRQIAEIVTKAAQRGWIGPAFA